MLLLKQVVNDCAQHTVYGKAMRPIVAELRSRCNNIVKRWIQQQIVLLVAEANCLLSGLEHLWCVQRPSSGKPPNGSADVIVRCEMQVGLVDQSTCEQVAAVLVYEARRTAHQVQAQHAHLRASIALAMPHRLMCCSVL